MICKTKNFDHPIDFRGVFMTPVSPALRQHQEEHDDLVQ
jgi:hypothetical protein